MEPGVDIEPGLDIDLDRKILPESDISKNRARVQTKKNGLGLEIGVDLLSEVRWWINLAFWVTGRGFNKSASLKLPRPTLLTAPHNHLTSDKRSNPISKPSSVFFVWTRARFFEISDSGRIFLSRSISKPGSISTPGSIFKSDSVFLFFFKFIFLFGFIFFSNSLFFTMFSLLPHSPSGVENLAGNLQTTINMHSFSCIYSWGRQCRLCGLRSGKFSSRKCVWFFQKLGSEQFLSQSKVRPDSIETWYPLDLQGASWRGVPMNFRGQTVYRKHQLRLCTQCSYQ